MRIVAIVQARMKSTRLPGHVLADLSGRPVLDWVVRRSSDSKLLDEVVVATTDGQTDDPIAERCQTLGVRCVRGDDEDVLSRFVLAAQSSRADVIVRIKGDGPLTDPALIDDVIRRQGEGKADCARLEGHPQGLDVEVFTRAALEAAREATTPDDRAQVTAFLYRHPERFRIASVTVDDPHPTERWTVGTAEDLALMRAVVSRLPNREEFGWRDVLAVLDREPQLRAMHARVG